MALPGIVRQRATSRPAEIRPGIILEYLAYLGIRELCGNNRGYTGIIARAYCARRVG